MNACLLTQYEIYKTLREIESRQGLTAVGKQQGGLRKGHDE
jgi:hypothetical protein